MWFNVAFNGIIPINVRDLSATWVWISVRKWKMFGRLFFSPRVNGTEGRRANKLKHMWTLQSHNIDSLVGRALIIDADRFLLYFIIFIFFCETDCQQAANLTKKMFSWNGINNHVASARTVRAGCECRLEPCTPAAQQERFLLSCTDVPHNGKRGEALCHPAEEATASQRLMILRVESFLMPRRHCYKNRPPPLCFPASSASPR